MTAFTLKAEERSILATFIGASIALAVLGFIYVGRSTDFGDAASLGAQTVSLFGPRYQCPNMHCSGDLEPCIMGIKFRNRPDKIIWLGNSQLHAINNYLEGDLNAPALLATSLQRRGADLLVFSQGNATFQEQYVTFEYLRSRVNFTQLIVPVVFDDFREDGVRHEIALFLKDETVKNSLNKTTFGSKLLTIYKSKIDETTNNTSVIHNPPQEKADNSSQEKVEATLAQWIKHFILIWQARDQISPQEKIDAILEQWIKRFTPIWQARDQMRGDIFLSLYRFRNTLFGITPDTKRKAIPSRLNNNLSALDALLKSASVAGIKVIIYIAPINNNSGERPYVDAEYQRFKDTVEILAQKYSVTYRNFEDIIDKPFWGLKGFTSIGGGKDEIDYMHFTTKGHVVLAENISSLLTNIAPKGKRD
jgi:hypothetical protein